TASETHQPFTSRNPSTPRRAEKSFAGNPQGYPEYRVYVVSWFHMHEAGAVALTSWRASVGVSTVPKSGTRHHGPAQSKGMCLLEFVVHRNLKPNASTAQIVDLPQVTSCPGPVSEPGAFMSCGYFPGGLVGPVKALAQAFTLPVISVPHWARSDAISKVIRARSTPWSCRPSANSAATTAGNPPTWPPKTRGSTSARRSSARSSMKMPALPLAFPAQRSPSHLPTRTKLRPSRLISP